MKTIKYFLFLFSFILFISCKSSQPTVGGDDQVVHPGGNPIIGLVPSSPPSALPFKDYCRRDDRGFIMLFQNSGEVESSEIQGTITFSGSPPIAFVIPKIPAKVGTINGSKEVIVTIPIDCFSSDCGFTIQWSNQPAINGQCIG